MKFPIDPRKFADRRTICEVLRDIYRAAEKRGDDATMAFANEAHDMAKRMQTKLNEYKARFDADA